MISTLVGFITILLFVGGAFLFGSFLLRNDKHAGIEDMIGMGFIVILILILSLLICSMIGQVVLGMFGFIR